MLESGSSGSVRGVLSNEHPYREPGPLADLRSWACRFYRNAFPRRSNSAEGDLFKVSHSQCTRCSGRQIYAASLYKWTAVIDSDSDASFA
jgi:hypothetical protein